MSGYTLLGLVHVSGLVRSKGGLPPKKNSFITPTIFATIISLFSP